MPLKSSNTSIVSVINYYLNKIEIYYIQISTFIESIFNILKNISIYKLKLNFNILNFNICTLYVPLTPQRGYFYVLRTGLWTERTIYLASEQRQNYYDIISIQCKKLLMNAF